MCQCLTTHNGLLAAYPCQYQTASLKHVHQGHDLKARVGREMGCYQKSPSRTLFWSERRTRIPMLEHPMQCQSRESSLCRVGQLTWHRRADTPCPAWRRRLVAQCSTSVPPLPARAQAKATQSSPGHCSHCIVRAENTRLPSHATSRGGCSHCLSPPAKPRSGPDFRLRICSMPNQGGCYPATPAEAC
eukprot:1465418-Rhodomonas_salina.2